MALFLYTVWFRDPVAEPTGVDPEWPACLLVEAGSVRAARARGDKLAHRRSARADSLCVHASEAEPMAGPLENPGFLPFVAAGAHPSDEELGW